MLRSCLLVAAAIAVSWATAAVPCGDRRCEDSEYCREGQLCHPCEDICDPHSPNYDSDPCKKNCADYLLIKMFVSRDEYNAAVSRFYFYTAAALVVSMLVLVLVLGAFFFIWLKYQRVRGYNTGAMKKKKVEAMKAVCVNEVDGKKNLKLEIGVPNTDNKDVPQSALTTMTPLSTRHPSEDATLEYAYDNPALTPSPLFGKTHPSSTPQAATSPNSTPRVPRTETSF
ncbi:uncharacterized protein LOC128992660 [Macrosteles quadrilineatus]|uniref:uncharacterized protein LOC128992660 n=1 Tax=Macrosteles quadrilineatus TaxID=74068 RepID=UPI0023E18952|nr:uncharacterized protein LOC128992660 [Macrosteles quadrilineatus]XP_054272329.1 uncharacterized protein LOC128992660 [Macrosteles quadrilineatus]